MSDPLLRELDHYVVLEPGGAERILSADETLRWLAGRLDTLAEPGRPAPPGRDRATGPAPARDGL